MGSGAVARNLPKKTPQRGVEAGRVSVDDFILQLKELQVLYGPAIKWTFNYPGRRIKIVVKTDKGTTRPFYAVLSNTKLNGGHPNMVTSLRTSQRGGVKQEFYLSLETFKKFMIGTIEKT